MALAEERASRAHAREAHDGDAVVAETIRRYADQALRIARRYTDDGDDALDVYQFGLLQLVRHKDRVRPETAHAWLFETIRREAAAVRERRRRLVPVTDDALGTMVSRQATAGSAEERVLDLDVAARATEALAVLKVDELRALALQASGLSYAEIGERLAWTATKTNRALTEGRRRFRTTYAELESGTACRRWAPLIADSADARPADRARLRLHLRNCPGCRATARELHDVPGVLALVLPVAVVGTTPRPPLLSRAADAVGRMGEAVVAGVTERGAGAAFKVQALLEAASSAKLAAVAASAVALTGGGVAVSGAREDRPAAVRVARATATATGAAPAARIPAGAAAVRASRERAVSRATAARRPRRSTEFAGTRTATRPPAGEFSRPSAPTRGTKSFESAASRGEFAGTPSSGASTTEFGG